MQNSKRNWLDPGGLSNIQKLVLALPVVVLTIAVLNIIALPIELRFEQSQYNYLFVKLLCVAIPSSILFSSLFFIRNVRFIGGVFISLVLAALCFFPFIVADSGYQSIVREGVDGSYEQLQEIKVDDSFYRLYRTNGGATTAFGLELRKEVPFVQGIKTVIVLYNKYEAYEGVFSIEENRRIRLQISPYGQDDKPETITLDM